MGVWVYGDSNGVNFLTERYEWAAMKRTWRLAERRLHALTDRMWRASEASIESTMSVDRVGQNVLTVNSTARWDADEIRRHKTQTLSVSEVDTLQRLDARVRQVFLEQQQLPQGYKQTVEDIPGQHQLEEELFLGFNHQAKVRLRDEPPTSNR